MAGDVSVAFGGTECKSLPCTGKSEVFPEDTRELGPDEVSAYSHRPRQGSEYLMYHISEPSYQPWKASTLSFL